MLVKELKSWLQNCPDEADIVIEKVIHKGLTLVAGVEGCRQIAKVDRTGKPRLVFYNYKPIEKVHQI